MLNKILIFGGLSLSITLIIENSIIQSRGIIFFYGTNGGVLTFSAIVLGILIGYGVRGFFNEESGDEDNYDF